MGGGRRDLPPRPAHAPRGPRGVHRAVGRPRGVAHRRRHPAGRDRRRHGRAAGGAWQRGVGRMAQRRARAPRHRLRRRAAGRGARHGDKGRGVAATWRRAGQRLGRGARHRQREPRPSRAVVGRPPDALHGEDRAARRIAWGRRGLGAWPRSPRPRPRPHGRRCRDDAVWAAPHYPRPSRRALPERPAPQAQGRGEPHGLCRRWQCAAGPDPVVQSAHHEADGGQRVAVRTQPAGRRVSRRLRRARAAGARRGAALWGPAGQVHPPARQAQRRGVHPRQPGRSGVDGPPRPQPPQRVRLVALQRARMRVHRARWGW